MKWNKSFVHHFSGVLTYKTYKEQILFNIINEQTKDNLIFKMGRASEQAFLQRNISMIPRIRFPKGMRLSA